MPASARPAADGRRRAVEPVEPTTRRCPPIPWHLWLLGPPLAVYLGYRAMQGIEWLFG